MMDEAMVSFMVMVQEDDAPWKGLGQHKFRLCPQIGHLVTVDDEHGKSQAYEVVAIVHPIPIDPAGTAGDLILRRVGDTLGEMMKAHRKPRGGGIEPHQRPNSSPR